MVNLLQIIESTPNQDLKDKYINIAEEIIKLKEENFVLKQKLDQIKDTLKNIFLNL